LSGRKTAQTRYKAPSSLNAEQLGRRPAEDRDAAVPTIGLIRPGAAFFRENE
jgi:hypothetical protein